LSRNDEASAQAGVVQAVRAVAPDVIIFSIPNGLWTTKRQASLARWTGLLAGAPDLALVLPDGRVAWWECKRPKGGILSLAQRDLHIRFAHLGHPVAIIRSIDDALDELRRLGVRTREVALG
jgi:hypothetical protein